MGEAISLGLGTEDAITFNTDGIIDYPTQGFGFNDDISFTTSDDVVTVPTGNITVEGTFTAKGGLQAENSSYIVEDLAGTINTIATKLAALEQDMRGVGAETASITTNISSK